MLLSIYSDIHSQDVLLLYMYVVRNIGRFPGFFQNFWSGISDQCFIIYVDLASPLEFWTLSAITLH